MEEDNPSWRLSPQDVRTAFFRSDGDINVPTQMGYEMFVQPSCPICGGILKPDMVFFGECVPQKTVDEVYARLSEVDGVMILGSSLMVFSVYRFVLKARELNIPMVVVNLGETRTDNQQFVTKIEKPIGHLPKKEIKNIKK
eukprot:TRINITY_DN12516_c0_g1_i1.p1 TRINITY_DN12516_c0_g1~~TRINITY_DN12516_c0_g1_i1.p1  ORF type:complete len:141 (-),score=36.12 TRINITY_DN12516_c0_g1_i1:42-464(-)